MENDELIFLLFIFVFGLLQSSTLTQCRCFFIFFPHISVFLLSSFWILSDSFCRVDFFIIWLRQPTARYCIDIDEMCLYNIGWHFSFSVRVYFIKCCWVGWFGEWFGFWIEHHQKGQNRPVLKIKCSAIFWETLIQL